MDKFTHSFDYLNHWDSLDDSEIEKIISDKTISILQEAIDLLEDESIIEKSVVARENFVALVRQMRKLCKEGSRSLGDAIIKASEFGDSNDYENAINVFKDFLSSCKSKFYRDIARGYIKKYSELT